MHTSQFVPSYGLHLTNIYLDTEIGSPNHFHPLFSSYNDAKDRN